MAGNRLVLDRGEVRAMLASGEVGKASVELATQVAGNANAVGSSRYEAGRSVVVGGWNNESRSGAVVREVDPSWRDARDSILLRVAESMEVTG